MECSITPQYTGRGETALAATQPSTSPVTAAATCRCSGQFAWSKVSQAGAAVSKLASPVSSPAW